MTPKRMMKYNPAFLTERELIDSFVVRKVDLELIMESYHSLSKVWSHVLRLDLSQSELAKVREARNLLEEILIKRGKSLD